MGETEGKLGLVLMGRAMLSKSSEHSGGMR